MGCDYYIVKLLHIYYNVTEYLEIELDRERMYYDEFDYDEDADDYHEKWEAYTSEILTPKMSPIVIYGDGRFRKEVFESKYKEIVDIKLHKHSKNWDEVVKIIKVEERHER